MKANILIALVSLTACQLNEGKSSISFEPTEQQRAIQRPLAVVLSGFMAPESLYGTFVSMAQEQGMDTLIISLPAEGVSPFRQDQSLAYSLARISSALREGKQTDRELYLFGHSLGGKIATTLALLDSSAGDLKLSEQVGGFENIDRDQLKELQRSLRGIFLLDPVFAGVDLNLMSKVQPALLKEKIRRLDSTLVSLPTEELVPRKHSEYAFRTMVVRAELGNRAKSAVELAESAQILRPRLGAVFGVIESTERAMSKMIQVNFSPCGPDYVTSRGKKLSGSELAYKLFSQRVVAGSVVGSPTVEGVAAESLDEEHQVKMVTIKNAGHMDVVNLQPLIFEGHDRFVRICATGPAVLEALKLKRETSVADSIENPYHAEVLALWKSFLRPN